MDKQKSAKRKIFIVGPTESAMTKRGNRHPILAKFLVDKGFRLEYVTSDFYHAEKVWFSKKQIDLAVNQSPYKLTVLRCLGYEHNISVRRIISNTLFSLKVFAYLLPRLNSNTVLILPSRPVELIFVSALLRLLKKTSVVLDIQDVWPDMLIIKNRFKRLMFVIYCNIYLYPSLRYIDKFMHVAPSFTNWLSRYSKNSKSEFIPLGFDANRWEKISIDDRILRTPIVNLVCVGMLQHQIDVMPVVEAIKNHSNVHFTIIGDDGDGERYAAVSKYVVDNAISNVTFVGQVDRSVMEEYLNNMDIGVIPMISSSIPNKVFDYIASYLPILVLGDNDSASFAVSQRVGWQVPYTAEGVSVFLSELQASDIHAKAQNISKIRDLYDRENLFSKVKDLIES